MLLRFRLSLAIRIVSLSVLCPALKPVVAPIARWLLKKLHEAGL